MKQQVKYEVIHLLKMANVSNDDIADRIAERICIIAKDH
jgi:Holliday junction resolvasome RuvABC endonuclease subunit